MLLVGFLLCWFELSTFFSLCSHLSGVLASSSSLYTSTTSRSCFVSSSVFPPPGRSLRRRVALVSWLSRFIEFFFIACASSTSPFFTGGGGACGGLSETGRDDCLALSCKAVVLLLVIIAVVFGGCGCLGEPYSEPAAIIQLVMAETEEDEDVCVCSLPAPTL